MTLRWIYLKSDLQSFYDTVRFDIRPGLGKLEQGISIARVEKTTSAVASANEAFAQRCDTH